MAIAPISIDDEQLGQRLTLGEAYQTMYEFLVAYHNRGERETGVLLGDICIVEGGGSADPAQLQDFLAAFEKLRPKGT